MGIKRKEKKPGGLGKLRHTGGSGSSREQSPLRPSYVPKMAPCHGNCPAGNPVRDMLRTINNYDFKDRSEDETWEECFRIFSRTTPIPASCGRVCPAICEQNCNRTDVDGAAVSIRCIERMIGDYALEKGLTYDLSGVEKQSEKVAVVGSGPAGLSCAFDLLKKGYDVTIFEAFAKAGGMLRYGIPDYRLPQDVLDKEVQRLVDAGVELKTNCAVGRDISFEDIQKDFDAVFVGIGCHKGYLLRVEGEDADNVMTGTGFLNDIHCGKTIEVGDNVIVIGGGDTAIDAARICRRLGAEVHIVYRRTIAEMPAIGPEIEEAQKEGVHIDFLAAPVKISKEGNLATGMTCLKCELGEPDSSGRRRPVPIEGSEFDIPASFIIPAISQEPDFDPLPMLHEGRDWIKIDDDGKVQGVEGHVFGGGDATNMGLVTVALGEGRRAAGSIHAALRGTEIEKPKAKPPVTADMVNKNFWPKKDAVGETHVSIEEALANLDLETTSTITLEQAREEATRCMSCGECFDCENCFKFCSENAVIRPFDKGAGYSFKLENCTGCKKCAEECPCGYIDLN